MSDKISRCKPSELFHGDEQNLDDVRNLAFDCLDEHHERLEAIESRARKAGTFKVCWDERGAVFARYAKGFSSRELASEFAAGLTRGGASITTLEIVEETEFEAE